MITDWLKGNILSLGLAVITLISTYAVYGYRISAVESRQDRQSDAITALQTDNTQTLVALAKIQTDIDYIKAQLTQIATTQMNQTTKN